MTRPFEIWEYAALAEQVYRRADTDQGLSFDELRFSAFSLEDLDEDAFLRIAGDNGIQIGTGNSVGFFAASNGFAASIVERGGKVVITFRGTDTTGEATADIGQLLNLAQNILAGSDAGDANPVLDAGDWINNRILGEGEPDRADVARHTQWQTAKALIDAVIASAIDPSNITVAGQSLGGGLAGLAAATYGFSGAIFGPAPFLNQLRVEAIPSALRLLRADIDENGNAPDGSLAAEYQRIFTDEFRKQSITDQILDLDATVDLDAVLLRTISIGGNFLTNFISSIRARLGCGLISANT